MEHLLDVIGDVHGELPALMALGKKLRYRVADGSWSHPEGRIPVFLGDLVDRGAHSLEVAELVMRLVTAGRAFCIMGNHEYNLVAWYSGWMNPKVSNEPTTKEVEQAQRSWEPALDFFRRLPLAVELPNVRIMHACWHRESLAAVEPILRPRERTSVFAADAYDWLDQHVVLLSPFNFDTRLKETRLRPGLHSKTAGSRADPPHEVLMKGYEVPEKPFQDIDGEWRKEIRAMWWSDGRAQVIPYETQVFGHYGSVPPVNGREVPPYPTGHPKLLKWAHSVVNCVNEDQRKRVLEGTARLSGDVVCIDFHGVTAVSENACIGALRWPEREVVWASAERTARKEPPPTSA